MSLSDEAKEGFEWAVDRVTELMNDGCTSKQALADIGIEDNESMLFFLQYLKENNIALLKRIK